MENMITYRKAAADDIRPALDLALRVFMEFEAAEYEPEGIENFKKGIEWKSANARNYLSGVWLMLVAVADENIIGVFESREAGRISMAFIDSAYHRQGIATAMMEQIVCALKLRGYDKVTIKSSPYGLPFYLHFGFVPTDTEQRIRGSVFTPIEYIPNEIWDVLDENGNKTGRYTERGRKMARGDYHLVVHVWKHNGRGEWLIDRRSLKRGTSIDGKWETTGGSAIAGDDSLTAALRETKEELAIDLDPNKGTLFHRIARHGDDGHTWLIDAWVFEVDIPIEDVRFQENETCDAMWATADKIREMMATGEFLSEWFYPYFDEMVERWK
ncbi:MAG: GNAT family N-acetyltransferase [Saccharofermentanales bacterium]